MTVAPAPGTPQGNDPADAARRAAEAIAAQAQQRNQIQSLAEALIPQTQPGAIVTKGIIVSWQTGFPPTVTIQLGGDSSNRISQVRYMDSYTPTAGDTVTIVKQGAEIFVLGKAHEFYANQPAKNGWQSVSLSSPWTANTTLMPVRYRKVFDSGDQKVQLQGRAWRSGTGTGTTLFTLPDGFRPGVQRAVLAARENFGGSNVVEVFINTTGVVEISGATVGAKGGAGGTDSVNHGGVSTGTVALDHWHGGTSSAFGMNPIAPWGGNPHFHITNSAFHSHTVYNVDFPGWVSLDGIEFFL